MLLSLDDYPHANIVDERILQSGMEGNTPDYIHAIVVVSYTTFSWWIVPCKNSIDLRYQLIPSRNIESCNMIKQKARLPIFNQKKVVSEDNFLWLTSWCKKPNIPLLFKHTDDQRSCNLIGYETCLAKKGSLRCHFPLMFTSM